MRHRVLLAAALSLTACGSPDQVERVTCATREPSLVERPPAASDTLDVLVRIDSLGPRTGRILVRVDPLDEDGVVRFVRVPPATTAAVGLALTTAGVFQGCLGEAAAGFLLHAPGAPADKAWLRVSAARPVRVRVQRRTGEAWVDALSGEPLVVAPGASGWSAWTARGGA